MMEKGNLEGHVAIFDLDGTLIDSKKKLRMDVYTALRRRGFNVSYAETDMNWSMIAAKYGLTMKNFLDILDPRKSWEDSIRDKEVKIFPETHEVLSKLRKRRIRLGLLTKSLEEYTNVKLDSFDLAKYFEQVVTVPMEASYDPFAIELVKRLDPSTINTAYFIGDREEEIYVEKAVRMKFSNFNLETWGVCINREGKGLNNYITIFSLDEIFRVIENGRKD